jgi:peptidoglycan/xylan/chitin deacetylase (PgdA/CDA1 family)
MQSLSKSAPLLVGIIIVAVGAGTTLQLGKRKSPSKSGARVARTQSAGTVATGSALSDQFSDDITQVLDERDRAASEYDWSHTGFLPSDVIDSARALKNPSAGGELCKALGELDASELTAFESAISRPESSRFLPCFNPLRKRLENYWDQTRARFAAANATAPIEFEAPVSIAVATGEILDGEAFPDSHFALTFDGGPDPLRTPQILEILKRSGVKATFFTTGEASQANSPLAQRIHDEGHAIGTLGWTARALSALDVKAADEQIEKGRSGSASASGAPVRFFRFPFGEATEFYQNFVTQKKMATFFWNIDSDDWKLSEPEAVLKRVLEQVDAKRHGIIRLHDSATQTGIVLPVLLQELRARKMQLVIFR